ncbi:MAG: response regulator [Chitinophagales bacterium]|nr:response regulator [Chitinophagales bacterium]
MQRDLIYVIDDDKANAFLNKVMFSDVGVENVKSFSMVEPALDELRRVCSEQKLEEFPVIILLDINLPVKTGWDFLDELRTLPCNFAPAPKVFITSSSDHPRDVNKAKSYTEVTDFLPKPMTEELATRLRDQYLRV